MADRPLRFHPGATSDYLEAIDWYNGRSPEVAERFVLEVEAAIERIASNPERWPRLSRSRHRRLLLCRFPFSLVYLVRESEIVLVAVAHDRRRPGYWGWRTGDENDESR